MNNKQKNQNLSSRKIMNAAIVLFANKGYESTTTREICSYAGVNLSLISYYFKNKEGLYLCIIDSIVNYGMTFLQADVDRAADISCDSSSRSPATAAQRSRIPPHSSSTRIHAASAPCSGEARSAEYSFRKNRVSGPRSWRRPVDNFPGPAECPPHCRSGGRGPPGRPAVRRSRRPSPRRRPVLRRPAAIRQGRRPGACPACRPPGT
ncbi:MAG: TetR/AcrR family transcriptional regulator, partial [Bacteroidia bacterium]|nr:TetR/AcrR family transcriptional regulator [Bacteroidia bacterium]